MKPCKSNFALLGKEKNRLLWCRELKGQLPYQCAQNYGVEMLRHVGRGFAIRNWSIGRVF